MAIERPSRRQRQAAETRQDIVAAARRLFAERGYAATSIADIANEAGTAIQTIYSSVGPKPALAMALNDLIDEEAEVPALARRLGEANEPAELIDITIRLTRQISERCGDIIRAMVSAAPLDPAVAAVVAEGNRRHRGGMQRIAIHLDELGALRPELSRDRAADVLAVLTWPEVYRMLVQEYGWSFDECEAWLNTTLSTLLLREPGAR